jgi:phosphoglycerate dehydrogenase-like enzyme
MKIVVLTFHRDDLAAFAPAHPGHDFVFPASADEAVQALADADLLVVSNRAYTQAFATAFCAGRFPKLRLIHFTTAGIDNGLDFGLPPGVPVTNASGVKAPVVSEHALALLLTLVHRMPQALASQHAEHWSREELTPSLGCLNGRRACVVGFGPIGREITRKLAAFDVTSVVVSRGGEATPHVERFYPREKLRDALATTDIVVAATNSDAQTIGMFDAAAFAAMPRGAIFINIARGNLADSDAMMAALRSGHLAGAGLDVAHLEPLPKGDPLWTTPNVVLTPHVAGAGSTGIPEQIALLGRILAALESGAAIPNRVR